MRKKEPKKSSISHYWDEDTIGWLRKQAKKDQRSVSWYLNNLVRLAMSYEHEAK